MKKIFFLVFVVFVSCKNSENTYKAPIFKDLTPVNKETLISDILCTNIWQMKLIDTLLILDCNNSLDKKSFHIYHTKTGNLLKTFGNRGNGPGELPHNYSMSIDSKNRKIYAIGPKKNISFCIDSILENKSGSTMYKQVECNVTLGALFLKDSLLFSENEFSKARDYRFAILKANGDTITSYKHLPPIREPDAENNYKIAFYTLRSTGTLNPSSTKYASAITCGLHLEIFNISDKKIILEKMHKYIKPSFKEGQSTGNDGVIEGIPYYMCSTEKYIYALWSKDTQSGDINQVAVFDWKGNAMYKYTLNDKIWGPIAIEPDDSKIYISTKDSEGKLNIITYNLPKM